MKQIISVIVLVISFSTLAQIDYYNSTSHYSEVDGISGNYYGLNIGKVKNKKYEKLIGKEVNVLHLEGEVSSQKLTRLASFEDLDEETMTNVTRKYPSLYRYSNNNITSKPLLILNKNVPISNYNVINWQKLEKKEVIKLMPTIKSYIKLNPGLGLWLKGKTLNEHFSGLVSKDKKWIMIKSPFGSYLLYENKIVHCNTEYAQKGANNLKLYGTIEINKKVHLLLKTNVYGIGTFEYKIGLFPFENGKLGKYAEPVFVPEPWI